MKQVFWEDFLILRNLSIYNHIAQKLAFIQETLKSFRKSWIDSTLIIPKQKSLV